MFLIRWTFWIGLVVMLLPTDKAQQERLVQHASHAAHWAMTFCERNDATCVQAGQLWQTFQTKAQFGLEMASDILRERAGTSLQSAAHPALPSPRPALEPTASRSPVPAAPPHAPMPELTRPVKPHDRLPLYTGERARWDG